jgi:hypothetical protein
MFSSLSGVELVRALDEFKVEDMGEEVLSVLVPSQVLEIFLDSPTNDIIIAAARVVRDTADRSEKCRRALVDAGGVEIVYEALKQHAEDNAAVFHATLGALGALSSYGGHTSDRACVSLPLLAELHKKHPSVCSTLEGLYLFAEDSRELFPDKVCICSLRTAVSSGGLYSR